MASELCIPIPKPLDNESELKSILESGFKDFNKIIPNINLKFTNSTDINGTACLSYTDDGLFCNYLISKFDLSVTEHGSYDYLCILTFRENGLLAYLVTYSFIKKFDSFATDDNGAIDDGKGYHDYTLDEIKKIILNCELDIIPSIE